MTETGLGFVQYRKRSQTSEYECYKGGDMVDEGRHVAERKDINIAEIAKMI